MVDLLRGYVVDRSTGRDSYDICGADGRIATNVSSRGIFDALFGVGVLGLTGCGPVFFFGFAVYN
jgi:hypothetical protein